MTSMTEELPAIVMPSTMAKPPVIVMPPRTAKPPVTLKPSSAKAPTRKETARAARRARALRSKTVIAIYLVVTMGVGAALLEMHGRAAAQAAARPAPRHVAPAPSVAPAPWGGWIG